VRRRKKEQREWREPLQKNRLYLEASPTNWVTLFPFIHRAYCPKCEEIELFYLDKLSGTDKAIMKSFEHGHTIEAPEVASAVERWFMG
jgi:hypothetical protein